MFHDSPSVEAVDELTIARMAALSGEGILGQAATTWDKSRPNASIICARICVCALEGNLELRDFARLAGFQRRVRIPPSATI
jgi:hypothetical protein